MDYPIHIDTIIIELSKFFERLPGQFSVKYACLSLEIVFILINSADPDEMPFYVAFHLDFRCMPKNLFTCI